MPPLRNPLTASPEEMKILQVLFSGRNCNGALHRRGMDIAVVGVCPRRGEDERKRMTFGHIARGVE